MNKALHRRPGFRTLAGGLLWLGLMALLYWRIDFRPAPLTLMANVGLFLLTLIAIIALVSQFVLPVRSWKERGAVIQRLMDYALGVRGPVLFLRNGQAVESKGERSRQGAGVLLADQTSAGVLRTETRYTRAVGPGVTFTEAGERLAEALDLRRQVRTLEAVLPSEDHHQQLGRSSSIALTEDGIPISADLTVTFMLDPGHNSTPREGQFPHLPPYEFNPRAAERAVYGHAHREEHASDWTELPILVAVDLWREHVKRWRLEALLASGGARPTPLEQIETGIKSQLVASDDHPRSREAAEQMREQQVLRRRGIRVLGVEIANLKVPEAIRREHLRRWREEWSSALEEGVLEARGRGQAAQWTGEQQGQQELADGLITHLNELLASGPRPGHRDTLIALISAGEELLQSPDLLGDSGALADHLRRLRAEVQQLDTDCRGESE
ncbi:MAG: hypothetical protein ACLFWD_03070 [Anaerolineales bacterium]